MLVVNLFGAPGSGKSTNASRLFTMLKDEGINCELVSEFAKDLTWEERHKTLTNQVYIFGKQYHKLHRLDGKVQVVITDSPLGLSLFYGDDNFKNLKPLILEVHNSFNSINIFLNRIKKYNPSGRRQTEIESDEVGVLIKGILNDYSIPFMETNGDKEGCEYIFKNILLNI